MAETVSMDAAGHTLYYKRSHFVTHLPVSYLYSAAHSWISRQADGVLRVGLTRFATRMLGEIVDHRFDTAVGGAVAPGQVLGWIEGFKAISDVFCVGSGQFSGGNPALGSNVTLISEDPYGHGWLYEFKGAPDSGCVDVLAYRAILDATIDRILEKQKGEEDA
jgi:glycine cleavage system H protein